MTRSPVPIEIEDPVHLRKPRSLYVHVPFCRHRCGYCDFTLVAGKDHLIEEYLDALQVEISALEASFDLDTLYLGGGTPSHLSPEQCRRLFEIIVRKCRFASGAEVTLEANPVDLTEESIDCWTSLGINRISLGAQSFDAKLLSLLERDHTGETAEEGIERLKRYIPNISLDLIFGVPGQSMSLWKQTLDRALKLGPTHLSTYCLTFEKGTDFWARKEKGTLRPVSDNREREMYALTIDRLNEAGLKQYEISSFAREGFRSQHNQVYWSGKPYLAIGPGAASYVNGVRETRHRSVTGWLKRIQDGNSGVADREELSDEDRARERLILGLRRIEGVRKDEFQRETGYRLDELAGAAIQKLKSRNWLIDSNKSLRLSREGIFFADSVTVELL